MGRCAKPRRANAAEIKEVKDWYVEYTRNYDIPWIEYTAVFDHYITDCPGYAGKVMVIIWGGDPSCHDVLIWVDGKIEKVDCH